MNEPSPDEAGPATVPVPPECAAGVARQLARLAGMAELVMAFPLDPRLEPASLVPDVRDGEHR